MTTWTEEEYALHLIKQKKSVRIAGQKDGEAVIGAAETLPEKKGSQLEQDFAYLLSVNGLPEPEREAVIIPGRKFRADFWYSRASLVIECEGGTFGKISGHNSGVGIERDCTKSRLYSLHGIRLYRVTQFSLNKNSAEIVAQLREILAPWYGFSPRRKEGHTSRTQETRNA